MKNQENNVNQTEVNTGVETVAPETTTPVNPINDLLAGIQGVNAQMPKPSTKIKIFTVAQNGMGYSCTLDGATKKVVFAKGITGTFATTLLANAVVAMQELNYVDFNALTEPVEVFVTQQLLETIQNGNYKYWIMTGHKKTGAVTDMIPEEELNIWKAFSQVMVQVGEKIIFKNTNRTQLNNFQGSRNRVTSEQRENAQVVGMLWDALGQTQTGQLQVETR